LEFRRGGALDIARRVVLREAAAVDHSRGDTWQDRSASANERLPRQQDSSAVANGRPPSQQRRGRSADTVLLAAALVAYAELAGAEVKKGGLGFNCDVYCFVYGVLCFCFCFCFCLCLCFVYLIVSFCDFVFSFAIWFRFAGTFNFTVSFRFIRFGYILVTK
jgi:hypothetical protein